MDFGMATFNEKINHHDGSGFTKPERSDPDPPDHNHNLDQQHIFPASKSSRTDYFDQPNKSMSMRSDSLLPASAPDANNMLSFSSAAATNTTKDGNHTSLFSFYQPSPAYIRNTGYGMHMPISRCKGPFTPSQWMELEHQALIYKHFIANVPVPSNLLNPLRKSLNTFLFPGPSSSTSYAPNSYGWGTFHVGFSGNTDPEPGRCRRTDGKKWRCSRDAVPDQKYCERHINRGRHRSRKPVEGQNGHTVTGSALPKAGPLVSQSSLPVSTTRVSTVNNHFKTLHHHNATTTDTPINRTQESQPFGSNVFSVPKQHNPVQESSDSLMYTTNFNSFMDQGAPNPNPSANPLPNFVNQWAKDQEPLKPDWTQLSMSIPMASDFSSSSNSPIQEKLSLGLTPEFDPNIKQASNRVPISWMGGPLGEVLNRTSSNSAINVSSSNSEMWDAVNYDMGSSPTGVLQKTTFVSLSNSSSGSSPKANKNDASLCDELLLSTLAS